MVDTKEQRPFLERRGPGGEPLHSRLDLASERSAVRWGRAHAAEVLTKWGQPESVTDSALLVVSELLTNAVKHARPTSSVPVRCSLLLWLTSRGLTVAVHDVDRRPPALRRPSPEAEGGRGLTLVESSSEEWGYTYPSVGSGKLVWARLATAPATAARSPDSSADSPTLTLVIT
jgi:anti-sigma regulatory factor (Ser/Thr protein kinase)